MSPCQNCHAGCCRSFAVPLTGADILRIERDLKTNFWEFACRWADRDGRIAQKYAPHFHFSDEPATPFVICLLHEASALFPRTTRCRFLDESAPDAGHPLGVGRCGIYGSRPAACRAFPTKFNAAGDLVLIHDVPADPPGAAHPVHALCPREWEVSDIDPIEAVQDLSAARYEMAVFHQVAATWNRRPQAWEVFPEFLRLVYSRRIVREADYEGDAPHIIKLPHRQGERRSHAA